MMFKYKLQTVLFLIAILAVLSANKLTAQQDPGFSQYMYNTMAVNPAYTGTIDGVSFLLLSRHQWVGFDGAPQTQTLTIHSPIDEKHIGLGLSYIKDKIGPVSSDDIYLNYSFKITPHEGAILSFGLKTGLTGRRVDLGSVDPLFDHDPTFNASEPSSWKANLGAGLYYFTEKYYIGLSVPKLRSHYFTDGYEKDQHIQKMHWFIIGGYVLDLNDEWKLKPSVLAKYVEGAPISVDINFNAMYNEKIVGGISHRFGDSFGWMMKFRIYDNIWAGYAYDFTINPMKSHNNGTHEVLLLFDLLRVEEVTSPRFF